MYRGVNQSAWVVSAMIMMVTVLFSTACAALRPGSSHAERKILQNECSTRAQSFFAGEFRGNNNAVCSRCSTGREAWCCRSDNFATPETCKRAGPDCCSGPDYRYTYIDRDGEVDGDMLDDVWCMPDTCTAAFDVNVWPVDPSTLPSTGSSNTTRPRRSPRPRSSPSPSPSPPINTAPKCTTSNEVRDFVGEYRPRNNAANREHNMRVCNACRDRDQVAWCCHSLNGDKASTDPTHCQPANNNNRCCSGQRFRYSYMENGEREWDTMDDIWCLPKECSP